MPEISITRNDEIGPWTLHAGALGIGAATGLRLGAILAFGLVSGLTTTDPDLVRAGAGVQSCASPTGSTTLPSLPIDSSPASDTSCR